MQNFDLKETTKGNRFAGLWKLVTGYRLMYMLAVLGVGLAALANTGIYLLIANFVDEGLKADNLREQLPFYALGVLGMALMQGLFSFLSGRQAAFVSEKITQRLRDFLYNHLQRLRFSYHDRMQTGDLLARTTSDVDTIRKMFAEQVLGFGRITLLFIVNFVALLLIDVQFALLSVIVIVPLIASSIWFFKAIEKRFEHFQARESALTNRLQETLAGVRVVKAFARQEYETERFEAENSAKLKSGYSLTNAHATYWPSTDMLAGLQVVGSLFLGGWMVINGRLTEGELIASIGLVNQIIWPVRNIGRILSEVSMGMVSFGRISEIISENREPNAEANAITPTQPPKGHIVFDNLTFDYDGEDTTVLHDINFAIQPGQTVALLGSTGSGKTTLVNLLPRFYDYAKGSIRLDGIELNQYPRDFLRSHIGIVMQEAFLFATTIRDNITYGVHRDVSDEELFAAAQAAAVHDVIQGFPDGYETLVGERGVTLSGGQKQRVTIARTILQNPEILIMDDSTSAVDTETESQIRAALHKLSATRTTFLIAHRIQSVMYADLILVMDGGRIVERGTHDELLMHDGIYSQIYELQAGIEADLMAEIEAASTTLPALVPA